MMTFKTLTILWIIITIIPQHMYAGSVEEQMQEVLEKEIKKFDIHGASATVIFPDGRVWTVLNSSFNV